MDVLIKKGGDILVFLTGAARKVFNDYVRIVQNFQRRGILSASSAKLPLRNKKRVTLFFYRQMCYDS